MKSVRITLLSAALAFSTGCATIQQKLRDFGFEIAPQVSDFQAVGTAFTGCTAEQKAEYEMDAEREYFFGRAIGARLLGNLGAKPLPPDHPVARYVDRVGQLLAVSTEVQGEVLVADRAKHEFSEQVDDRPWPLTGYHFVVIPLEEPNAFGSPGGLVTLTTGLLKKLQSEDELAGVLAHEIIHVHRGHGVEVMKSHLCQSKAQGKVATQVGDEMGQAVGSVAGSLGGAAFANKTDQELGELLESGVKGALSLVSKGYPEILELEADRMAVRLLVSTGYSPQAFDDLLFRMKREADGNDKYLDTHPPFEKRILAVRPAMARYSKEAQKGRPEDVKLRAARFAETLKQLESGTKVTER